jgi:ferredoxin
MAAKLHDVAQPFLVVTSDDADGDGLAELHKGKIVEVRGRLGDFCVTVENASGPATLRRELKADQVVIISEDGSYPCKPRTGCHLLSDPTEAELDRVAEQVRELTGEFLKPVQVNYETEICAGGSANHEGCGICISACPYDAVGRDPENHLRVRVDHMACEGCGACVSACPTSALHFTEPSPHELYTKMAALLASLPGQNGGEALTVLFHCGEQGRRVLEEAGRRPLPYPPSVLPIEVPCLRYVSEANMLAAFRLGAAGVGLLGCERCRHGERELLYQKFDFCRFTLDAFALGPERLRLITADEGTESEAVLALAGFAETLKPPPIHWDGKPMRYWDNRQVIAETIRTFIEQTGREPGRRPFDAPYPFAFADVKESGCTMCRACVNACPTHAFKLDEKTQSLQFKHIACVACGLCETACPEKVITLRRELFIERDALEYQTVVQDDMVSCANCGKPYVNRKALEAIESRVLSLESLLDTFTGNRRNLLRMCPDCRAVVAMLEVEKGWKP